MKTNLSQRFRKALPLAGLGFAILFLAGCGPEEFVHWAPDGQHAYVAGEPAMLVDSSGNKLGSVLAEHEGFLGWMPDSRRILVASSVKPRSWEEYAQQLGGERAEGIKLLGGSLAELLSRYHDDWLQFGATPAVKAWREILELRGEDLDSVLYYLDHARPGLLAPIMAATAQIVDDEKADKSGLFLSKKADYVPSLSELHLRDTFPTNAPPADQLLIRLADSIAWASPSPLGRAVAFVQSEAGNSQLYVLTAEPNARRVLVDSGVEFAAWSPDGQELAYAKTPIPSRFQNSSLHLGTIARRRICTPEGEVLGEPEGAEELASLILSDRPRVAWLPDGRIMFASVSFTLPATTENLPKQLTLFAVKPGSPATLESLVPAQVQPQLPKRVDRFALSPDGRKVAIPGESGAVSVLFLETGTLAPIQPEIPKLGEHRDYYALTPSWRTADELCYVVPAGDPAASPARAEVVNTTLRGGKRPISKSWPNSPFLPPNLADP